jgi:hypothetical protein
MDVDLEGSPRENYGKEPSKEVEDWNATAFPAKEDAARQPIAPLPDAPCSQ